MQNSHYPSLLVLANNEHAKWFVVDEEQIKEIESSSNPLDRHTDKEGAFQAGGGMGDDMNAWHKDHNQHQARTVAERTKALWEAGTYMHLSCAAGEPLAHVLMSELKRTLPNVSAHVVIGNYLHAHKDGFRDVFLSSIRPQ